MGFPAWAMGCSVPSAVSASQAEGTQCLKGFTVIKFTKVAIHFTSVIFPTAVFIVTVLSNKFALYQSKMIFPFSASKFTMSKSWYSGQEENRFIFSFKKFTLEEFTANKAARS